MKKYKERRVIYSDSLQQLCIRKGWYTMGDIEEYNKMISTIDGKKNVTTRDIVKIAINIMEHTDEPERELESYCFEIAGIAITFFEPVKECNTHLGV